MDDMSEIYQDHARTVYKFLLSQTHDPDLAEELTQETFYQAVRSIDRFDGGCKISVWLCQIAKNCYFSNMKRQQRYTEMEDIDTMPEMAASEDIESWFEKESDAMQIHSLLHQLPEPYKEVFMLRVFGELSFRQIAGIFGKTENWACVTYHRARKKILEKMEADNE